ncbi:MAG TPA: vWA domain-containing protein [Candidatus Binatia bacterium]|nr:vWA domain-containing protein [Candidatus Binatia bacterium]
MYEAEISRRNPTAFLLLIDQSGSMAQRFGMDVSTTKAQFVADVVNRWLQGLVLKSAKGRDIRDYFHVGVLAFGGEVRWALAAGASGGLLPISQIATNPIRIENRQQKVDDGAGGIIERTVKFPIWVEPRASGNTPMRAALTLARDVMAPWVAEHRGSFPPAVLTVTDGEFTDGDPLPLASEIRNLATDDGRVLLLNCHISGGGGRPILYPSSDTDLPDRFARLLFQMSSELPAALRGVARDFGYELSEGARGYAYQADAAAFVQFLEIGTRSGRSLVRQE